MLRITLESPNQIKEIAPQPKEDLTFEVKVVTEGLFPEVRLSFVSDQPRKRFKNSPSDIPGGHKENLFR
ncbi:MAG TPA: hypothetical protein PLZ15_03605 [Melioribacteraceae bacterium]|nr:hypothetical protein [Melioribacteraceae bacterium]